MSFDLTKTMPDEVLENCSISTWNPNYCGCDEQSAIFLKMPYCDLYNNIKKEIESQGLKTSSKGIETILRIGIYSIGSPLWKSGDNDVDDLHLVRFLYVLKALLRHSFAVAVITIPSFLFSVSYYYFLCIFYTVRYCSLHLYSMQNPLIFNNHMLYIFMYKPRKFRNFF